MSVWVRVETNIDAHPDLLEAGPWALIAFQTLVRIAKELNEGGLVPTKFATGKHIARRSLFDPAAFARQFDEAVEALIASGLVDRIEGGLQIGGWSRFQLDPTNAERQQNYRERKKAEASNVTRDVTGVTRSHSDVTGVTDVTTTGRDGTYGTGRTGQEPPPPSSVGRREAEEEDSRPIYPGADVGPETTQTPTPATDPRKFAPPAPPTTADDCRPPKAVPRRQLRRDAAPVDESPAVVELWNSAAAPAGCPPAPPAIDLGPATRLRCTELLRRHGMDGMRQAFAKVAASDFLSGRSGKAKFPWTLQRVIAPEAWGRLLAGEFDSREGRAGPATGRGGVERARPTVRDGLELLEFESEELRRWALDPHNGLEPHEIRSMSLEGGAREEAS